MDLQRETLSANDTITKTKHKTDGQSDMFSHAYQSTDSALGVKRKMMSKPLVHNEEESEVLKDNSYVLTKTTFHMLCNEIGPVQLYCPIAQMSHEVNVFSSWFMRIFSFRIKKFIHFN